MDFTEGVKKIQVMEQEKAKQRQLNTQSQMQAQQIRSIVNAVLFSLSEQLNFQQNATSKVEVTNPTPATDNSEVVKKLDELLNEELKKSTDTAMLDLVKSIKQTLVDLPEKLEQPEQREDVRVTNLKDYTEVLQRIENYLKEQPAPVFSPEIEVKPSDVVIDLSKLEKLIGELKKAVKLEVNVPEVDNSLLISAMESVKQSVDGIVIPKPANFVASFRDTNGKATSAELNPDGSIPVNINGNLIPNVDYDYIDAQQTSATVETYIYKLGGSGGTVIRTVVVTYTDSTKADLDYVEFS